MKTVAIIPIKMNNERLPGKNIKLFSNGKALIQFILETLSEVHEIDEIYVYCSNPEIKNYFPNNRIKFLKRSERLDLSTTKINEILLSFANDVDADIYVLSHATAPFIRGERFSDGIKAVKSGKFDSAVAITKFQEFLWYNGRPYNYDLSSIPRTQDLPLMYVETSGMYIFKSELIKKENRRIGHMPYFVEVSQIEACDIDNPADFEIADAIYSHILEKQKKDDVL